YLLIFYNSLFLTKKTLFKLMKRVFLFLYYLIVDLNNGMSSCFTTSTKPKSLIRISGITVRAIEEKAIAGDLFPTETPSSIAHLLNASTFLASDDIGSGDINPAIGSSTYARTSPCCARHRPPPQAFSLFAAISISAGFLPTTTKL